MPNIIESAALKSMKKVFPESALSIRSAVKDCLSAGEKPVLEIRFAKVCFFSFLKMGLSMPDISLWPMIKIFTTCQHQMDFKLKYTFEEYKHI